MARAPVSLFTILGTREPRRFCGIEFRESQAMAKRVLILGGGFGGIYAALRLEKLLRRRNDMEATLVTRDNFFLFTPMLHEIAASDLEVNTIVNPLRKLLRRVNTFIGTIDAIDIAARRVFATHGLDGHGHELAYDHVVLALGSGTNFFNLPGVEEFAVTMKSLSDAIELRNRIITHLEEANSECAAGERQPLLTFVVAGGGFAGVETLGAINDFMRDALPFYPNLRPEFVRTVLVTPDHMILPELGPKLGAYAQRKLAARGVEIITGARVTGVHRGVVELNSGQKIEANSLIWTAGTAPNPLVAALGIPTRNGKIEVNEYLQVRGFEGVWAVGDCALVPNTRGGGFHPPTAQHALREGRAVADNVAAAILGRAKRPFRFATLGQLSAIGRRTGVANILGINFSGFIAWWLWRTIYLSKLPRLEKKVRVAFDWTLDLFFAKDFADVTAGRSAYSRAAEDADHARSTRSSDPVGKLTLAH
jgi:NADH dehydrogenase